MNLKFLLGSTLLVTGLVMGASTLHAESLTLEKTTVRARTGPERGLSMSQVEKRYGAPDAKLPPAGGDTPLHPVINRWKYDGFTVYFERNIVIHSVRDGA
jgi:hypothetical protein